MLEKNLVIIVVRLVLCNNFLIGSARQAVLFTRHLILMLRFYNVDTKSFEVTVRDAAARQSIKKVQ